MTGTDLETATGETPMVAVRGVHKFFGDLHVLRGIDLDIAAGEVCVILGPSGSGKSTLLRCVNLLEEPNDGTIMVGDTEVTDPDVDINRVRTHMGMVFQQFNLFGHLNILDNCTIAQIKVLGRSKEEAEAVALEQLAKVGLAGKEDRFPAQLSGGQKQRVGIARALAPKPQVILADEPTSALDPATTRSVLECLEDINKRFNVTIVIVTHEMSVIRRLCDRAALLDKGKVVEIVEVRGNQIHAQSEIGRELIREN